VQQYWDPDHVLATRMKNDARPPQPEQDCCVRAGILWDLAAVYPPGAVWADRMPSAVMFNGPVVDVIEGIEAALAGQAPQTPAASTLTPPTDAGDLVFLTRVGCANTTVMRRNLDAALKAIGRTSGYEVADQDALPTNDIRRGYPTPTLLYRDRDVFGMPAPEPPLPDPT
jgi:hypothetical protein